MTKTHHVQGSALDRITELLAEHGFESLAQAVAALEAAPDQRTEQRNGYANRFKPKTGGTRLGALIVHLLQIRATSSTPRPWERGVRGGRHRTGGGRGCYAQGSRPAGSASHY